MGILSPRRLRNNAICNGICSNELALPAIPLSENLCRWGAS